MSASFSGSEVRIHSPRWSSLENVERSEAKSLIGLVERLTQTQSYDMHTSPLGCTSDLVDNNSGTQQNATDHAANFCDKQIGVTKKAANVDLHRRLANLGINNQSDMDLTHPQMEVDDDNHKQCTSLAELSFRIDSPSDLGSEFKNLDASNNTLFGKGTESQVYCGASNFASEGQVGMLVLQCKSEMSLTKNVHAVNPTSFAHIDERMGRILNSEGAVRSDLVMYTPDCNNVIGREARVPDYANADCIEGKLMKIEGVELRKSSLSMLSNEPRISSLLKRECQSQVFSSRKNYESVKASCKDKYGTELERSITHPRASQVQKVMQAQTRVEDEVVDYEDLYLPQATLPNERHNYKTPFNLSGHQKVSRLEEEELYPVLMNDKLASFSQRQGFVGSSFAFQNDVNSDGADLNNAMAENFAYLVSSSQLSSAKANSLQIHNNGAEGNFVDQFDYSPFCFAGPQEHPHARFQKFRCHSNEQYTVDPYCSRLPSSSRACALPMASHQFTGPQFASQKDINVAPNANTCYNQHACMQLPSHTPSSRRPHLCAPTFTQHSPMSYQPLHTEDQYRRHTTDGRCSRNLSQRGLHKQQLHGGAGPGSQSQSTACLARKENCPPLPGPGAAPYVLCQGCDKILQVPAYLHNKSAVQRIRCGACGRTSKFCNALHPYSRALLKDGLATGSIQTADGSPFLNKHRALSTPARMGRSEQIFSYDAIKVPMSAKLDRNLRSSCGLGGQHNRVDKQIITQANATPVSSYDVRKLNAFCHPRLTTTMLLEQGPCESEWRYDTTYRIPDNSGIVREDYPSSLPFIVNGSGVLRNAAGHSSHKMQQLKARVGSNSQYAELGQGKEAFEAPRFADDFIQERSDSRVRVSSGELQALTLECLQEGTQEGSCDGSPLMENIVNHSLQQGLGHVGVFNNGLNEASCSPAPGSPLCEHLSYDAASEFGEWAYKHEEKGKEAGAEPSVQEVSKGSKFLSGLLKKNIREFGRGQGSNKNWKVVVNGQMLPYAAIKSAEKQAGTIRPGIYWYDYQAGFWGVMGGPCLGIIPPSIAEFNVPLAKECAGGTTGVFVNGRELHKKDLDALAGRGLPKTFGKAYMVDISGQVVDQASGQMLRSLGRLAPTIERRGRGCGMFQPSTQS